MVTWQQPADIVTAGVCFGLTHFFQHQLKSQIFDLMQCKVTHFNLKRSIIHAFVA